MAVLFPRPVTVFKQSGGSRVKGRWVAGAYTEETITGRVRHFTAYEILSLPDGKANTGNVKVFSNDPLNTSEDGGDAFGDIVFWEGRYYEVVRESHKPQGVISHYRYEAEFRQPEEIGIVP
jgi:hypothetical protein